MTRRKPLGWMSTVWGDLPDCPTCMDRLMVPGFVEAVSSVAIEHPTTSYDLARRALDYFHANRHREEAPVVPS